MTLEDRTTGRPALVALAAISWSGVLLQFGLSISMALANGKSAVDGIVIFLGYFTVLTNLFVALTATLPLVAGSSSPGRWFARPAVLGCATTSIVLVGVAYHVLLRDVWEPQGLQWVTDFVLHYLVPILALAYWVVYPPRGRLGVPVLLAWCLYPIGYIAYAFVRGEVLGSYPYHFIDVGTLGYRQALLNGLGLLLVFLVFGAAILVIAQFRNRSRMSSVSG